MKEEVIIQICVAKKGGVTAVKTFYQSEGSWFADVEVEMADGCTKLVSQDHVGDHGSLAVYAAVVSLVEAFRTVVPDSEIPGIVPVENQNQAVN